MKYFINLFIIKLFSHIFNKNLNNNDEVRICNKIYHNADFDNILIIKNIKLLVK